MNFSKNYSFKMQLEFKFFRFPLATERNFFRNKPVQFEEYS